MTLPPDCGYQKSRAELINYELAAFAALRAGVPDCYRDGSDNTAWGWILHTLARQVGALDYLEQYQLIARNPALLTPPDLLRQVVPLLPLGNNYPNPLQSDQQFRSLVLGLLKAYRQGARLPALSAVIEAFTDADPSSFSVTEMYRQIGSPGIDCSYRNTIRVEVPITGSNGNLFTQNPQLIQDIYRALAATKAAHIGLELVGVFPKSEDASGTIQSITDSFRIIMALADGAAEFQGLTLAPYRAAGSSRTVLAPSQDLDLSYQWFEDGSPLEGATEAELVLTASMNGPDTTETHLYYALVSDPVLGQAWSQVTPLLVSTIAASPLPSALPAQPPLQPSGSLVITQQPMSFSVLVGKPVSLSVAAADASVLGRLVPHQASPWVIKSDTLRFGFNVISAQPLVLNGSAAGIVTLPTTMAGSALALNLTGAATGEAYYLGELGSALALGPIGGHVIAALRISASSSQPLHLTGSAAAVLSIGASSSQTLTLAGSSAAVVATMAQSNQSLLLTGNAVASVAPAGGSNQALHLTANGVAIIAVRGGSNQPLALTGSSAAVISTIASSNQPLQLTGNAAAALGNRGQSNQPLGLTGSGTAIVNSTGSSNQSLLITGSGSGISDTYGGQPYGTAVRNTRVRNTSGPATPVGGGSSQPLHLTGNASGILRDSGTSSQPLQLTGNASGTTIDSGSSNQPLQLAGSAVAALGNSGGSNQSLNLTGYASSNPVTLGSSSQALKLTGGASGTTSASGGQPYGTAVRNTRARDSSH